MKTLRARLLVFTSAATATILVACAVAVYLFSRASLYGEFDHALLAASGTLIATSEQQAKGAHLEAGAAHVPEYSRKDSPDYYQVWVESGPVMSRSSSLGTGDLSRPVGQAFTPIFSDVTLPDGSRGRQIALSYIPRVSDANRPGVAQYTPRVATLVIARRTDSLEANLRNLRQLLFMVGDIATAVTAFTLFFAVSHGLRPLGVLASRIARTSSENLLTPIDLPNTPGELSVVVQRLNELLARLHNAITREQAFTADVSHELRTPLAGLEVTLEIASLKQREPADYETRIRKSLGIVREMRSMVDNLLTLARAEAGQLSVNQSEMDLSHLVEACWANFQDAADDRGLTTSLDLKPCIVRTDPDKLRIVLQNLMDNAVTYCDAHGEIALAVRCVDDTVEFAIANPSHSITQAQAPRVFDRFWRADLSRTDTGVHCGLGLSLAQKIAPLLGTTLEVRVLDSHVFQARFRLPPGTVQSCATVQITVPLAESVRS